MECSAIRYDIVESPLAGLLVAATRRGVCSVRFGDDVEGLEAALRLEFPWATLVRDREGLADRVAALLRGIAGTTRRVDVPLDVRASQFQRRVWDAIRAIPAGATRSYSEIARELGCPRGARAVARACAANPVAVAIPCHRVVAKSGGEGGYRWGVERKRALLRREQEAAARAHAGRLARHRCRSGDPRAGAVPVAPRL
jgi:AraC family transcriptional regulator of adaptative response/methylated-DNA-[protein]-cysteine methyltransferase